MIIKIRKRLLDFFLNLIYFGLFIFIIFFSVTMSTNNVTGLNVTNATVIARVNVSGTEPSLYKVIFDNPVPIDLTANTATTIRCNGSVFDLNGFDDIKNVTGTFYLASVGPNDINDNNTHYINQSCGNCTAVPGTENRNGTCTCQFAVQYYANPGLWQCNITVNDSTGFISSENTSFTTVNEVLGISVESSIMDYGNLSVTQISPFVRQNVTNGGNMPINVTVRGYGGSDEGEGTNLTMLCEFGGNISFGYQRYYPGNFTTFNDMLNLTNQSRQIFNLTIPQRTNDARPDNSTNSTYWKLEIPPNVGGICNGTIIFGALDATP